MSTGLILLVTACYLGVAINEARGGNMPMAVVFAGYSLANVGFIMGVGK